ncbi:MAG: hypothetical protein ACWGSD_08435 [Thermodesulfobacteriota bacterium]
MGILQDLKAELANYPVAHIKLSVTDFKEPGTVINRGEICEFRMKVTNTGELDLTNVVLHVHPVSTLVYLTQKTMGTILGPGYPINPIGSGIAASFPIDFSGGTQVVHVGTVLASGGTAESNTIYLQANNETSETTLFHSHLWGWDASLGHIMKDHTDPNWSCKVEYKRPIYGD